MSRGALALTNRAVCIWPGFWVHWKNCLITPPLEPATQNLAFHKVNIPPRGLCYTQRVLITAMALLGPALMFCAKGYTGF